VPREKPYLGGSGRYTGEKPFSEATAEAIEGEVLCPKLERAAEDAGLKLIRQPARSVAGHLRRGVQNRFLVRLLILLLEDGARPGRTLRFAARRSRAHHETLGIEQARRWVPCADGCRWVASVAERPEAERRQLDHGDGAVACPLQHLPGAGILVESIVNPNALRG
jgi:hypothetical protein